MVGSRGTALVLVRTELHALGAADRVIAGGSIDPTSLAVSADGRIGYWTGDGVAHSATIAG